MKGSAIRRAEERDAENIRRLYQASIQGLCLNQYSPEQIGRWINRPLDAFARDIQNTLVILCEFQDEPIGYGQMDPQAGTILAIYVHPDFARRNIGSLLFCFMECEAWSADLPRLTAQVPLRFDSKRLLLREMRDG